MGIGSKDNISEHDRLLIVENDFEGVKTSIDEIKQSQKAFQANILDILKGVKPPLDIAKTIYIIVATVGLTTSLIGGVNYLINSRLQIPLEQIKHQDQKAEEQNKLNNQKIEKLNNNMNTITGIVQLQQSDIKGFQSELVRNGLFIDNYIFTDKYPERIRLLEYQQIIRNK